MTKKDIETIIQLFIHWNGVECPIDIANISSAVDFIDKCLINNQK